MTDPIAARQNNICCAGTAIATILFFILGLGSSIFLVFAVIALLAGLYLFFSKGS